MRNANKLTALVLAAVGLAGPSAFAEENKPNEGTGVENMESCPERFGPGRHANRLERIEKQLSALHGDLKLTADQETAWNTWADHVHKQLAEWKEKRPDFEALQNLPAPERMEKWLAFAKDHQAKLEQGLAAIKVFYGTLTPEQRQTFDKGFDVFHPGGWKGKHRPAD